MHNLYKKAFPKRSEREIYFDVLRMSETMFEQFQKCAHHMNPYNDYFYTDNIKAPSTKLLPSSLDSISTLDNQSTLVPLVAMEREAHSNHKNDFHRGGGLYETVCAVFRSLWNVVGTEDQFNHWFNYFNYTAPTHKITSSEKTFARFIDETYSDPDRREEHIGAWTRDDLPAFDTEHYSVWVNEDTRTVHVAICGTKLTSNDIWSDCELLLGRESGAASNLEQYLNDVTDMYKGWLFECSAHSLGCASLSEVFYHKIHPEFLRVYLFNPPLSPLYNVTQAQFVVNDTRFHLFLNTGDPICNLYASVIPDDRENVTWANPGSNPLKNHSIDQWV